MRITFESDDLQAIAEVVVRKLAPLIVKMQESAVRQMPPVKHVQMEELQTVRVINTVGEVIRRKELSQITGLSMTTLWRQEREGYFPARIRLTNHTVGWRRSEIEAWLATRPTV